MTIGDVNRADKIFGPGIGSLKGKNNIQKPKTAKYDVEEIIPEVIYQHKELTHYTETMFLNDIPMLTGTDKSIRNRYMVYLNTHSADDPHKDIDKIFIDKTN